eukprot:3890526-Prorocentrum_lima.AAC.1
MTYFKPCRLAIGCPLQLTNPMATSPPRFGVKARGREHLAFLADTIKASAMIVARIKTSIVIVEKVT